MAEVDITGTDQFLRLSKALKDAGRTGKGSLRNELHAGIRKSVKRAMPKARQALAAGTPAGVDPRSLRVKQVAQVKTGKDPGVTVGVRYGKRGTGLGASNARLANAQGLLRHPLWGNRERWFNTPVPGAKGWFDDTYRAEAPAIRRDIEQAMQDVVEKIVREAR